MASLVIAEHNGNTLLPSTLSTITAAKAINSDIDILMLGYGIESIAVKASHIQGYPLYLLLTAHYSNTFWQRMWKNRSAIFE